MRADLSGVGATPRLLPSSTSGPAVSPGPVPTEPVGPVAPSTALVPVVPTGTRETSGAPSPLGRSGLDLLDVIGTTDVLVERGTVAPLALGVGLETARGALLRGLASESLATLDSVWARAQFTEEGWYLRSGALTVLGLPGEAERVSTAALQLKPSSVALRFMQSIARLANGDLPGARSAVAAALEQQATHPVLLMQQILVLARQGHRREADRLLQRVARLFPEHPAVEFARTSLRSIAADHTRSTSRSAVGGRVAEASPFPIADDDLFAGGADGARDAVHEPTMDGEPRWGSTTEAESMDAPPVTGTDADDPLGHRAAADAVTGNVAEDAMTRLGARFATLSVRDAVREGRALVRAFSAGGSMAGACTPEQAHAARGVLTAIVSALGNGASRTRTIDAASPLAVLLSQWLPMMQEERFDDAARLVRRLGDSIPDAQRRLLAACAQSPLEAPPRDEREPAVLSGVGEYDAPVQGEQVKGPLLPVRFGLGLLEERAPERAPERSRDRARAQSPGSGDLDGAVWSRTPTSVPVAEPIWGSRASETPPAQSGWIDRPQALLLHEAMTREAMTRGVMTGEVMTGRATPNGLDAGGGVRIEALLCVIVAAGAGISGAGAVAVAFGLGAAWLGLRRGAQPVEYPNVAGDRRTLHGD
jgi:hypothetical protein